MTARAAIFGALLLASATSDTAIATTPSFEPELYDPVGVIYHYTRSNWDGSKVEFISIYRETEQDIAVYRMRERCTNAALLTARIDPVTGQTISLVDGKLTRDGRQEGIAWLTHEGPYLNFRQNAPDGPPDEQVALAPGAAWRLYDFDFAGWFGHWVFGVPPSFQLAVLDPDTGSDGRRLRLFGEVTVRADGEEYFRVNGRGIRTDRYTLAGPAFSGSAGGTIWLELTNRVIQVRLNHPNNASHENYMLVRTGEDHGAEAWRARLADHWTGCPAP